MHCFQFKNKFKLVLPFVIFILFIMVFFIFSQVALAVDCDPNTDPNKCYGLPTTADKAYGGADKIPFTKDGKSVGLSTVIGQVVGAALAFIGIVFFILIIYGGFTWMTARGNEQQVTKAKDLIVSAAIGLVIVLAAYAITYYIGSVLTEPSTSTTDLTP